MRFGIFVFGDNHPELGRPNRQYDEEVLSIAEWAEELGFDIISNNIGRGIDVTEASSVRVGGISETTASANTITFNGNQGSERGIPLALTSAGIPSPTTLPMALE